MSFSIRFVKLAVIHALKEVKGGIEIETAIYSLKGQLLGRAVGIDSIDEINWNRG